MEGQNSDPGGGNSPQIGKKRVRAVDMSRRHDSVSQQREENVQGSVTTRSGRTVKPSAVLRESVSDSSGDNGTPAKKSRKQSNSNGRSKTRQKFVVHTSSETGSSSQESQLTNQSQVSRDSKLSDSEGQSPDLTDDNNTGDREVTELSNENRNNRESLQGQTIAAVSADSSHNKASETDEVNKSLKVVLDNPSALEAVMKSVMPAFVKMSQQMATEQQKTGPTPCVDERDIPVLARGESCTGEVSNNFQQLNISDNQVDQGGRKMPEESTLQQVSVPVRGNESEVTVYRRGCTKVGEADSWKHLPIIQDIQNQLNRLNDSLSVSCRGEDRNIVLNTSDSDNVTSDESLLVTSSEELDNSAMNSQQINSIAGRAGPAQYHRSQQNRPGCSGVQTEVSAVRGATAMNHIELEKIRAEERAKEIVKQAANAKTTLLKPPGENTGIIDPSDSLIVNHDHGKNGCTGSEPGTSGLSQPGEVRDRFRQAFMIDQKHSVLGAHVDYCIREAIQRGDYINLARLLPKDTVVPDDDLDRYHMVGADGHSYYVKRSDEVNKDLGLPITSLARWDEAFRTYSAIYLERHPWKATQLAEYVNYIHRQAATFIWGNVYNYDILFRRIMITDPERDWDIVNYRYAMEQFTDRLVDRPRNNFQNSSSGGFKRKVHKRDPCWRFNRTGKCKFGNSCTFDHRCAGCGALDHGQHECKAKRDKPAPSPPSAKPSTISKSDSQTTSKGTKH